MKIRLFDYYWPDKASHHLMYVSANILTFIDASNFLLLCSLYL